jgi:hypothetical protein
LRSIVAWDGGLLANLWTFQLYPGVGFYNALGEVDRAPFTVESNARSGAALCDTAAIVPEKNIDRAQITTKGETFIIVI